MRRAAFSYRAVSAAWTLALLASLGGSPVCAQNDPSAQREKSQILEQTLPSEPRDRFYRLAEIAKAEIDAGQYDKAQAYATELLDDAPKYPDDWNYGNAIFYGNTILGRVAIERDNNVAQADSYLASSVATPGSPQLDAAGPNMTLAKDLLSAGERDSVLDFLDRCRSFWKINNNQLDEWSNDIRDGAAPNFGANLKY